MTASGFLDGLEELWLYSKEPNVGVVCCIPFFLNGVSLGDTVQFDSNDRLVATQNHNGHCVVRIAVVNAVDDDRLHVVIHALIAKKELAHEWRSVGYVAVDLPPAIDNTEFLDEIKGLTTTEAVQFEVS